VNENAFAFIVQARPCPTFGRPVHLRGGPHRLQPGTSPHALRIPPRDGHPALRELRSGGSRSALVCFRLSPSCPFRPLHTFHSSRPARNYPRFWIRRSSFERRRDLNPPDQRAAQRTLRAHPSPSRRSPISRFSRLYGSLLRRFRSGARRASPVARCILVIVLSLLPRQSVAPHRSDCDAPCCLRSITESSASGANIFEATCAFTFVTAR
jgi:hypothetical protein